MDIQAMVDGMSARWQRERSETQMTLGRLIADLEAMPADTDVSGLAEPHSYRGYYCDLAFEPTSGTVKAGALLAECKSAMGQVFTGYKGGDFVMGALTPVWVAHYGCCGEKLIAIHQDGKLEVAKDE
jgi:hypothetical protein